MSARFKEFLTDLNLFFADLMGLCSWQTAQSLLAGSWGNLRRDNSRKIPLLLTVAFHLAVLLFAIAAPSIMVSKSPSIPEIYTVNLYNIQEVAPPPPPPIAKVVKVATPPPISKVVKVTTPPFPKTVGAEAVAKAAVSLSPIRQRLAREMKEKEAQKRQKELQDRKIEQVKLNYLREQAEKEAVQAENALAEAKRDAAATIADFYRQNAESKAMDNRRITADATATSTGKGEIDPQKQEALDRYRARLFAHISPHWQLPELQEWDENLRAVIVMQVNRDGTITNSYFEKRSANLRFNQYAQKAIDNAQPLPPFPIDFHEKSEEIAVTFSPGGLL